MLYKDITAILINLIRSKSLYEAAEKNRIIYDMLQRID